jgi:hypothetical protein
MGEETSLLHDWNLIFSGITCLIMFFLSSYSFIHMCKHCLGHFSLLLPGSPGSFPPSPSHFQAEPVLPLSLILLNIRQKHNKEDKEFLLVELRIAIQKDS